MKAPDFWDNPPDHPGWQATALAPLAALYASATARRVARPPAWRAPVPVICIGNINAGGTGKTPAAIAIATRLAGAGFRPHILSRGYGGSLQKAVKVDERQHKADDVGDEPLLLSAFTDVWVGPDRTETARLAVAAGADILLMDDGFQNPALAKDLSVLVVDAAAGFGNGRIIPAGPLRESPTSGLSRAGLVLSIGPDRAHRALCATWPALTTRPCQRALIEPLETGIDWGDMRVLAFAGIGRPQKFFATLAGLGADIAESVALGDHQPLSPQLLHRLQARARATGAQLVTTEKDAVRLPPTMRSEVLTLPVRLVAQNWDALDQALRDAGIEAPAKGAEGSAPA